MRTSTAKKSKTGRTRVRRIADRELEREDWLITARKLLIAEGFNAVRVERLAKVLGVTRGGFYWRFKKLGELQQALVEDWRRSNSRSLLAATRGPGGLSRRFDRVVQVWLHELDYDHAWDTAMREWGRADPVVANVVHEVDDERLAALQAMFAEAGLPNDAALVRARVLYYHQVGYYAMDVRESMARRRALLPLYKAALSGLDPEALMCVDSREADRATS
jgi:AcrR family transcriptional regulator